MATSVSDVSDTDGYDEPEPRPDAGGVEPTDELVEPEPDPVKSLLNLFPGSRVIKGGS